VISFEFRYLHVVHVRTRTACAPATSLNYKCRCSSACNAMPLYSGAIYARSVGRSVGGVGGASTLLFIRRYIVALFYRRFACCRLRPLDGASGARPPDIVEDPARRWSAFRCLLALASVLDEFDHRPRDLGDAWSPPARVCACARVCFER